MFRQWHVVTICAMLAAAALAAREQNAGEQVRRDTELFSRAPSRLVGSEGHRQSLRILEQRLRAMTHVQLWTHDFEVTVPRTQIANLMLEGTENSSIPIYPLYPAGVRTHTLPEDGLQATLVHVGDGELGSLPVKTVRDRIAVMNSTGADSWRTLFALGADAVILLGQDHETTYDLQSHVLPAPFNFPRYYVPPGAAADHLRQAARLQRSATLVCRQTWQATPARNLYALVQGAPGVEPREALTIAVPIDSMSVVPDLAPGADAAVDVATALAALERLSTKPPRHPVLVTFIDAYSINQAGMRHMLMALGALPDVFDTLQADDRARLKEYRELENLARTLEQMPDFLNHAHETRFRGLRAPIKQELQKDLLAIDARLEPLRLALYDADEQQTQQLKPRIDELENQRFRFYRALNQIIQATTVDEDTRPKSRELWDRARARIAGQLQRVEAILERDAECQRLRAEILAAMGLEQRPEQPRRPIRFLLGLDLSDAGLAAGPSLQDDFIGVNETRNARDFTSWLQVRLRDPTQPVWPRGAMRPGAGARDVMAPLAVDVAPVTNELVSPSSHMVGQTGNLTAACPSYGLPAMTWATLDGLRQRVDTPRDTAANLDWARLGPQVTATLQLIETWTGAADFDPPERKAMSHLLRVHASVVDQASGEPVARVPMEEYLATLLYGTGTFIRHLEHVPGLRNYEFQRTGVDGRVVFDAIPGDVGWFARLLGFHAYDLDADGSVSRAINQQQSGKTIRLDVDRRWRKAQPLRAVVFSCREHSLSDLYDPRFLMPLPQVSLLDSRRGNPKRLNSALYDGMMCFFLEHTVRWQMLLRVGIVGNRMVLVNALSPDEAGELSIRDSLRGFASTGGLPGHPFMTSAQDFYRLDARRLDDYQKAGIANKAIRAMQEETASALAEMRQALQENDGARFFRNAMGAMANEVRAYQAVRRTADDVIRGAIFLLLVLLPFSYAMERLLFASPHVYHQIGGATGIFAVMTAILWSFHPAFRMSTMPLMIVMAFGVIVMSLVVILMIFSKFENELEKMRSGKAEASSAKTSRFGLVSTAVRLGIANMRKRKLRTALTGVTVVLITFALLCFMSASTYVGKSEYTLSTDGVSPSVLVRQPGERELPRQALTFLRNIVHGGRDVIPRFWWCNSWDPQWRIHLRNPASGKQISLTAGLGLSPDEHRVSRIDEVCPNWERFAQGDGLYLSEEMAAELGVTPGEQIAVAGRNLTLVGTFSPTDFDRLMIRLDRKSMLPPDYSAMDDQERRQRSRADIQTLMLELESGGMTDDDTGTLALSGNQVVILPAEVLKGVRGTSLRNMAIPAQSDEDARRLAVDLSGRLAFPIYYGGGNGVQVIASTPLSPKAPKSLLIPLLIAGFIIFNTMLSSLAERHAEIYIYTSLGLAPLHIGVLFLAEAVTYGLLGSICGYIIGQGLATVFSALGWMGGITLNFGGTQAMVTMLLVLAVVVVSSLVPAYLAGKVATPSNEMRWRVPDPERHDGVDVISETLPFTATSRTAAGIVAFLFEFFDAHQDGAIGHFTTGNLTVKQTRENERNTLAVEGTVWLAPYDLGVRQYMRLVVAELTEEEDDLFEITVRLTHGAGQSRNWQRLNRAFLGTLRRQLLGWRKLTSERVVAYIRNGQKLVAENA